MNTEELTYEAAITRLETIVRDLETGTQALESLGEQLKEAQALAAFCKAKLEKTEQEVECVMVDNNKLRQQ